MNGPTRSENVARAQALRATGLKRAEIASRMGVATSTVRGWLYDPDSAKRRAWNQSQMTPCADCGGPTSGTAGRRSPPIRCWQCHVRFKAESRTWTRDETTDAITRFAERYQRQPCATDFNPPAARALGHHQRAERFMRDGDYPYYTDVRRVFGSWNAAIRAAGFVSRGPGEYPRLGREGAHLLRDEPARPTRATP